MLANRIIQGFGCRGPACYSGYMANSRIGPETRAKIADAWRGIIDAIADGELISRTIEAAGFSREMLRAYLADTPGAREEWDSARKFSADAFFDRAHEVINSPDLDPKIARVRFEGFMLLAAKRDPRMYGDRSQVDVNVRTVDLTRIIQDANARLQAQQQGRLIDSTAQRVQDLLPELAGLL